MSTSEQRVRARKTRQADAVPVEQDSKIGRRRRSGITAWNVPSTWSCEGQISLFDPDEGGDRDA